MVETRTKLINAVRGVLASFGERLPASTGEWFARRAMPNLPAVLRDEVRPAMLAIEALSAQIQVYDRMAEKLCRERYLVCFVNGLPLVVIEAKRPDSGNPNKDPLA